MELSKRLASAAGMITAGNALVDVGTDHAWLPVWLVTNGICPYAVAMDVRPGPLERAKQHIHEYGLEDRIETRLSDGLMALVPDLVPESGLVSGEHGETVSGTGFRNRLSGPGQEYDGNKAEGRWGRGQWTLVIAGMGGPLMEKILVRGKAVLPLFSEAVLQPQSDLPHFRRFLGRAGFSVIQEKMVIEEGKFYPMMKVLLPEADSMDEYAGQTQERLRSGEEESPYTLEELFGPFLLAERNPALKEYLERERQISGRILQNLEHAGSASGARRRKEILLYRQQLDEALIRMR